MELELKRGGRTARVETLGGELVSYRDERGLEYIWGGDLEIAVKAGGHQQLLELLRRLRQGVEFARMVSGRHQVVPGAFW